MTEALKAWAWEQSAKAMCADYVQHHALSPMAAEFWIRAVCDEVEKRYQDTCPNSIMPYSARWLLLNGLKRELLGN